MFLVYPLTLHQVVIDKINESFEFKAVQLFRLCNPFHSTDLSSPENVR